MNKILIRLESASELLCYEAVSLAMTLATFDNHVQLVCGQQAFMTLMTPASRIYGMLQALELYDMPKMWLVDSQFAHWLLANVEESLASQIILQPKQVGWSEFESVLSF